MKVNANGVEIHYVVEGDGPWVTMAHPLATDLRFWEGQARVLARHFTVLRFDIRGHGQSGTPAQPYSFDQLVEDVHQLLDALHVAQTHWVGLSLGGMIGQAYALKHPAMLQSMLLADTTSRHDPGRRSVWQERARAAQERGMGALVDGMLARWFTEPYRHRRKDVLAEIANCIESTRAAGYAGCCHAIAEVDFLDRLHEITCPVLVVVGEQDSGTPPRMARLMCETLPNSQLLVIPEAAHLSSIEQPEVFNMAMMGFLGVT